MQDEFELLDSCLKPIQNKDVIMGPGDDCSVISFDQNHYQISTMDCLIEDTHFKRNQISMEQLAYKALAVNISDIAAMGGQPLWCHLSLVLPKSFLSKDVKDFFDSFYKVAEANKISLLGGNTCSTASGLAIHIHLSGLVKKENIQRRSDFKGSDYLCVTNSLGDSSAGLHLLSHRHLSEKVSVDLEETALIHRHFCPPIETEKALWLASQKTVHGMMDLSDGLLSDLRHIPDVELKIQLEKIPLSKALKKYCEKIKGDPYEFSIAGGEDYAILFGCEKSEMANLRKSFKDQFASDFYIIGEISGGIKKTTWLKNNEPVEIQYEHFNHF